MENRNALISIIIPVYNVEKYLRKCLNSVVNQTYRNLEILVVDDGSTDGSGQICDEYAELDDRITVYHTENRGLSAARNHALNVVKGEYISFIDSDDWLELDAYETLLHTALNTDAGIVAFRFFQEYVNKTAESSESEEPFTAEGDDILKKLLIEHRITSDVWNKFYRVELFNSIRYPEGRIFEDIATTHQILQKAGKLVYLPDCLIHYRNRERSISNIHTMESLVDYWWAYQERFETISIISEEFYKLSLADCINAISRMWRWYAGCSKKDRINNVAILIEMQMFAKKHQKEILEDPYYSKHIKLTCLYARSMNPLLFKALYLMTGVYRSKNRDIFYEY